MRTVRLSEAGNEEVGLIAKSTHFRMELLTLRLNEPITRRTRD